LANISRSYDYGYDDILGDHFLSGHSVDWWKIRQYKQTTKDEALWYTGMWSDTT